MSKIEIFKVILFLALVIVLVPFLLLFEILNTIVEFFTPRRNRLMEIVSQNLREYDKAPSNPYF